MAQAVKNSKVFRPPASLIISIYLCIACCTVSSRPLGAQMEATCGCASSQQSLRQLLSTVPRASIDGTSSSSEPSVTTIKIDDMIIPIEDLIKRVVESSPSDSRPGSSQSSDFDPRLYISCRRLWPNGRLYYKFSTDYPTKYKPLIRQSLAKLSQQTNNLINFTEADNITGVAYVTVINDDGCYSYVGKIYSASSQSLSLSVPGCMLESIIQHEFMHALGFIHEHSRIDRDNYVQILWYNILTDSCHNFFKDNLIIPSDFPSYDYSSVMQYTSDSFSCETNLSTILIKSTGRPIIQRTNLTSMDIAKLNYFYSRRNLQLCFPTSTSTTTTSTTSTRTVAMGIKQASSIHNNYNRLNHYIVFCLYFLGIRLAIY